METPISFNAKTSLFQFHYSKPSALNDIKFGLEKVFHFSEHLLIP